jgi:pilus assembly protein CpaB
MLRALVLVIAVAASGLTAWFINSMGSEPAAPAVVAESIQAPVTDVLVASADLIPGKVLAEEDLRWRPWPLDAAGPGFINRTIKPNAISELKGYVVRSQFVSGEPIRDDKLSSTASSLLAGMLPPGKRAVAIRVSAESTAGGFILPHDRVDVILTSTPETERQAGSTSRTLLNNIRVLAVDQQANESQGKAVVGETVTLELDPFQAEIVATGKASGTLSLALRSSADSNDVVVAKGISSIRIVRGGRTEFVNVQQ